MTQTLADAVSRCIACGQPATRTDADGIPLCAQDYQHLLQHWRLERFDAPDA